MCGSSNRNVRIPGRNATHPARFTRDSIPEISSLAERLSVNCQFFFDEKKIDQIWCLLQAWWGDRKNILVQNHDTFASPLSHETITEKIGESRDEIIQHSWDH